MVGSSYIRLYILYFDHFSSQVWLAVIRILLLISKYVEQLVHEFMICANISTYSSGCLGSYRVTFWLALYYQLMNYDIRDIHQAPPSSLLSGNARVWLSFTLNYHALCIVWSWLIVIVTRLRGLNKREVEHLCYKGCTGHCLVHECISVHYVNDQIY